MLSYEECKKAAVKKAEEHGIELDTAYSIGQDFVFESSKEECIGILPVVVSRKDGQCMGLWPYLNQHDMSMDDMQKVDF